jgi:hypothetical protein
MKGSPRLFVPTIACLCLLLLASAPCVAWGPEGHRVIGLLALNQASPDALSTLRKLSKNSEPDVLAEACNWPDRYRATKEGAWSTPQHYLNVPRAAGGYLPERDCAGERCVAGAIRQYVEELGTPELDDRQRWEAWARVCHFIGDVHQPLHAGFGEDRGGNDTLVVFNGETTNLHRFWDRSLINFNYPEWSLLAQDLEVRLRPLPPRTWVPSDVDAWVLESHRLVRTLVYPQQEIISPEFAASSWLLALDQISKAARRLAWVIDSSLAD